MSTSRERARAIAFLAGGLGAAVAYVLQRTVEVAQSGPVDPTLILATSHVAFYWRAAIAGWLGVVVAGVVYAWLVRRELPAKRLVRWMTWGVVPVAMVLALMSWWMP